MAPTATTRSADQLAPLGADMAAKIWLFIDILSGTIAIVGAVQLQRTYGLLQQRDVSLKGLIDIAKKISDSDESLALVHHLGFLEVVVFQLLTSLRMWNAISESLNESADLVERTIEGSKVEAIEESKVEDALKHFLLDYRYTTDQLAASGFRTSLVFAADLTVSTLVLVGLGCLIGGAFCFVLYNQPVEIWATSLAVLGSTILLIALVIAFIVGLRPGR
ncbi:hypothetical protein B0H13DRAFT_2091924 [Mycena leptocephala]|nr:hypothetical protein B0H13DRAFT_2091924 [Mycena leptocephala]